MSEFIENAIQRLNDKRSRLNAEIELIEREIGRVQRQCVHERDPYPNAWWCRWCGAEVKATAVEK